MMRSRKMVGLACTGAMVATALSCGDVPTLPGGVAYISGVIAPSLAVAAGDTLRDSLGRVAPLRVDAYDRNGELVPGIEVHFLVTSLDSGIKIDSATGYLIASDSLRTIRLVGQTLGRLQTPEITLQVVPQPDQLQPKSGSGAIKPDASFGGIVSPPLDVTVSGVRSGSRVGVPSILVRYEITTVFAPAGQPDTAFALVGDAKKFDIKAPRVAVDTTDANGFASRRVRVTSDAFDSLRVTVTASDLKNQKLAGSPFTYTLVRGY
jgi:hypothetical protein